MQLSQVIQRMGMASLLWAVCHGLAAQPDSLLQLDDLNGVRTLHHWFESQRHDNLQPGLQRLQKHYRKQGKPLLEKYAWLAGQICWIEEANKNRDEVEKRYFNAAKEARQKGWKDTEGELWVLIGNFYSGSQQYGKAFEYCLRGYYRFQELGLEENPHLYKYLGHIADIYYRMGDWESCLKYLSILNQVPSPFFITLPRFHVQNSMGLAYRHLNKFDSSEYYFKASYENARALNDTFWMALSQGNLGYNYYLQGRYEAALPLLYQDYRISLDNQQSESAANAGLILADIYLRQQKTALALEIMLNVQATVLEQKTPRWMRSWYENQFHMSAQQGRQQDAIKFADSALQYLTLTASSKNAQLMANTRSKVEAEQYLTQIALLEGKRQQSVLLRNALLIGLVLVAIILLLAINRAQVRHRFAMEKAALEKEQSAQQLQLLQAQLEQYTTSIREKSRLIDQFETELSFLKTNQTENSAVQENALGQLLQASILTEEEWQRFRDLFEKVHPGFLLKVRQLYPDLTPAETRMLVMAKLKLTNKEMMTMLGIGYDAVKKVRQRLRKKIHLAEEANLELWVEQV